MNKIKELPSSSSHLLSCTQVITSINCVVKELVENAIDSSSKNIEIKLVDYGLDKIEVKDSGSGIHKDDISKVAKPHCTSKITSHLDLNNVQTYGFRGEALSALCALSDLLIFTKTAEEEFGFSYSFDHKGNVTSSKPFPCTEGTTVSVVNLFKNVPVRKQYYRTDKAKKDELKKVEDTLIAFGCIHPDIRLALFHNQSLIWQKPTVKTIREGLVAIFGNFIVDYMQNCEFADEKSQVNIEVFLPKSDAPPLCSSTSTNRSIISINKRPVRMKAIDKVLKEYFNKSQSFSKSRYPFCYIAINVPPSETDVNVDPNKTTVMLTNLDAIITQLSAILKTFYDNNPISEITNKDIPKLLNSKHPNNDLDQSSKVKCVSFDSNLKKSDINIIHSPLLTPELRHSNIKSLSRKLSRQSSDKSTPSTKRIKTTTSNDIYQHIKTLDSFIQSSETVDHIKLNQGTQCDEEINMSEILLDTIKPKESKSSCDVNMLITAPDLLQPARNIEERTNSLVDNHSNIDHSGVSVTVERKNLEQINSSDQLLNYLMSESPYKLELNKTGLASGSKHVANISEHAADQCITLNTESSEKDKNNSSNCVENFRTAKSILESNEMLNNLQQYSTDDKMCPVIHSTKENCVFENNIPNVEDWSRGKDVIGDLEPVIVFQQQVIKSKESPICQVEKNKKSPIEQIVKSKESAIQQILESKESSILKGRNDKRQSLDTVPNQRKMTAFDFFCRKYRLEVASLHPHMDNNQLAQILTDRWRTLASDEKAIYKNMVDKDYPKNIKKKETLGRSACDNLSKGKEISSKPKKKIKRKYPEKTIPFEMELSKNFSNINSCNVTCEQFNIINCISPGIWIYSQEERIFLLNTFRLQEIVIYQRLLETFVFEPEPLEFPCIVSTNSLGEEAMKMIMHLYNDGAYSDGILIDDRIEANGFKINVIKNDEEEHIQITGMTTKIAFYSVLDLKEILKILKEKGTKTKLSECRPKKVEIYLQNEAVRIARQCPPCTKIDFVKDLIKKMKSLSPNCDKCIHSKPFLQEMFKMS